jgi:hypothetical protein
MTSVPAAHRCSLVPGTEKTDRCRHPFTVDGIKSGRRLRHKNTLPVATGPDLRLPVARERQVSQP